ncbi:uncharacterized [Tachysurus ichikawai]
MKTKPSKCAKHWERPEASSVPLLIWSALVSYKASAYQDEKMDEQGTVGQVLEEEEAMSTSWELSVELTMRRQVAQS